MRTDPLWLSLAAGRVVQDAQVPYQVARKLIRTGMDEETAIGWARAWKWTGTPLDRIIRAWRRTQPNRRRARR